MTYRLGRKPNSGKRRLTLTDALVGASYTPPASVDYYSMIPGASWGMDGNDEVGDCTCAMVDHQAKSDEVVAKNTEVSSTATEVLAAYSAITGYTPSNPNSDQGAEIQDVLNYWVKTGFKLGGASHKATLFAEVSVSNMNLVKWALDQFGAVSVGLNFPESAMDQFNAGQPWDVVKNSPIEGGHAVALVGYDANYLYVVTWGQVQKMTPAFWTKYVEEAWAVLDTEFVNAKSGVDVLGGTLYQLGQQYAAVTGKLNPFPAPTPTPTPTPAPNPLPVAGVTAADVASAVRSALTNLGV